MKEQKYIPLSELKVGTEIQGYTKGSMTAFCTKEIVSIKNNTVSFNWGDPLEEASDYMFAVALTDKELKEKYKNEVQEIKEALNHKLGQVDGYHEMWNTWLYSSDSLAHMASEMKQSNLRIIGYATLTVPKHSMFSDKVLDIGIVAEYTNSGERIWCHASDEYRKKLLEEQDYE